MTIPHDDALVDESSAFLFVGNDPCLDFLNTLIVQRGHQVDLLRSLEDLLRWLVAAGLLAEEQAADLARRWSGTAEGTAALDEAHAFRALMLSMVNGILAGLPPTPEAIAAINSMLRRRVAYARVTVSEAEAPACALQWEYAYAEPRDLLAPLAHAAAVLVCEREWTRIKACENPACVLHFYDTSKNGSRRWCDTRGCGNRLRVAQHYRRTRSAPTARDAHT
jgi:predicted RNA-binding Zn ribbon-like protein